MDIIEQLDEDDDVSVIFEEISETGNSILKFSVADGLNEIRIYPQGIHKLMKLLKLIQVNGLIKE